MPRFGGTVVLHCFSSPALLPIALERGYYVSFAGNVTFPNASELRMGGVACRPIASSAETDRPYLAPQPVRGGRTSPRTSSTRSRALWRSAQREDPAELEAQIEANASTAFGL